MNRLPKRRRYTHPRLSLRDIPAILSRALRSRPVGTPATRHRAHAVALSSPTATVRASRDAAFRPQGSAATYSCHDARPVPTRADS